MTKPSDPPDLFEDIFGEWADLAKLIGFFVLLAASGLVMWGLRSAGESSCVADGGTPTHPDLRWCIHEETP